MDDEKEKIPTVRFTFPDANNKSQEELDLEIQQLIKKRNDILIKEYGYTVDDKGNLKKPSEKLNH